MLKRLSLFLAFFSSIYAFSQTVERQPGPIIVCPAGEFDGHHHVPTAEWIRESMENHQSSLRGNETSCANIDVTYIGFTPEAEAAFQAAVDIWESSLSSEVTIKVEANWTVLGEGVLGSAGPEAVFRFFDNAPDNNYYASALADKIAGSDQDPGEPDIKANFNSDFDWYLGTDGNTPDDQYDLTSVVLHELGHGLGFVSSKDYDEDTGEGFFGIGAQEIPMNYDAFLTLGANGSALLDIPNGTVLGDAFTSNEVYNDSPEAIAANGGNAPRMYAPASYAGGSSISHWNESTYTAGDPNSLMTPQIGSGEAIHNPGGITLGLFEDMGWTLCESIVVDCAIDPLTLDGPESICPGETTVVEVVDAPIIPVNGEIAIQFLDVANQEMITLTGVTLPYSFDNDLNGVLSANDFDPFAGEYELTALVYTDVDDLENSTCATSSAPVTVYFLAENDPACSSNDPCSIGALILNGPESLCPGDSTTIEVEVQAEVPLGGGIGVQFIEVASQDGINLTGVTLPYTFDNDLNGLLSANGFDPFVGEYELTAFVYSDVDDLENSVCAINDTPVTVFFLDAGDPACNSIPIPCDEWVSPTSTTGYIDFNNDFGGAPCDDGSGCPFNEIQAFEVWGSEAYSVDNFMEGGTYTFSVCNGPGAGSWVPDFTIIAPSGTIDAFGTGDGCAITWTATEDGTYLIVINEFGNCGVGNQINNGYPALTCEDGTADCSVEPCSIDALTLDGPDTICPEISTTVETSTPAEVPSGGGIAIEFLNVATQEAINLTGVDLPYTFDNDLNGVLSANGIDPFVGDYELTAFVYADVDDLANSTCATASAPVSVEFLAENDPSCVDGINDEIWDNAWEVYPNPAVGEVTIRLKAAIHGEVTIKLYDVSGRLVKEEANIQAADENNIWQLNIANLNQGVYYVVLENPIFKASKPLLIGN